MQVKPYNVGVSVVFPPDTDTPGFENENKNKVSESEAIYCMNLFLAPVSD